MNIKEQCCTVEQGKRLVELGVPKEGVLFWHMPARSTVHGEYIHYGWLGDNLAPAFNVTDLGALLPTFCYSWKGRNGQWCAQYSKEEPNSDGVDYIIEKGFTAVGSTEAQARAALLIHLLENKIITFKPDTVTLAGNNGEKTRN